MVCKFWSSIGLIPGVVLFSLCCETPQYCSPSLVFLVLLWLFSGNNPYKTIFGISATFDVSLCQFKDSIFKTLVLVHLICFSSNSWRCPKWKKCSYLHSYSYSEKVEKWTCRRNTAGIFHTRSNFPLNVAMGFADLVLNAVIDYAATFLWNNIYKKCSYNSTCTDTARTTLTTSCSTQLSPHPSG